MRPGLCRSVFKTDDRPKGYPAGGPGRCTAAIISSEGEDPMIVRMSPHTDTELGRTDMAWFESDASDNNQAIREIDAEAAKHGLARTREYWLQTFSLPDGRVVRRGFCYRPGPSPRLDRVAARRGSEAEGLPSAELVRGIREGE